MIQFEWDPAKARVNLRKHGVPFREAASVFRDPLGITIFDPDHSEEEDRFVTFGFSGGGRLLLVAHTHRREGTNLVLLDRDIAEAFPSDEAVNAALRLVIQLKKLPKSEKRSVPKESDPAT